MLSKKYKLSFENFKNKLNESLVLEFIKHVSRHKNSKGESAPWVIISHKTNKILSSHKTKEEAEKHLQQMHIFKNK